MKADGRIMWQSEHSPFGQQTSEAGLEQHTATYTGKDYDEDAGLYYFNARWFRPGRPICRGRQDVRPAANDAELGRFVTLDPARDGSNCDGQDGLIATAPWMASSRGYAYVRNNPLGYVDPTGLENVDIESHYKMNQTGADWRNDRITEDPAGTMIKDGGCAITAAANLAYTIGEDSNPGQINSGEGNVVRGNLDWGNIASDYQMVVERENGEFSTENYEANGEDDDHQYYTFVKVQYDTDPNHPHWVGVNGTRTVAGVDYVVISPTSTNDSRVGTGTLRQQQGWIEDQGDILVPTDKTSRTVIFSRPAANQ